MPVSEMRIPKTGRLSDFSMVTQLLIFRDKNVNLGLLVPHIHALTYYTIPSPQSLLRADFSRDPTKASLRLATHPTTDYYSSPHSCYKWELSATNFQVLLVYFSHPDFGRIVFKLLGTTCYQLLIRKEIY